MCEALVEVVKAVYSEKRLVSFKPELICDGDPFKTLESRLELTPVDGGSSGNTEWKVYRVGKSMLFIVVWHEGQGKYRIKHIVFTPHKVVVHVRSSRSARKANEGTERPQATGSM